MSKKIGKLDDRLSSLEELIKMQQKAYNVDVKNNDISKSLNKLDKILRQKNQLAVKAEQVSELKNEIIAFLNTFVPSHQFGDARSGPASPAGLVAERSDRPVDGNARRGMSS